MRCKSESWCNRTGGLKEEKDIRGVCKGERPWEDTANCDLRAPASRTKDTKFLFFMLPSLLNFVIAI